jgi:hypothetical protein
MTMKFTITAQYTPTPTGGVRTSLTVSSKDTVRLGKTIPEEIKGLFKRFWEIRKASDAPVSEHMDIMLGLLRDANYEPETAERITHEGVITEWTITFHGE